MKWTFLRATFGHSKSLWLLIFSLSLTLPGVSQNKDSFEAGNQSFMLNGKPFVVRAGELHFPRIPREYWENRIQMCKAMGMNTVCIYLFWNFHEQTPDAFDFTGQKDVAAFVKLVQKNGMYVIVRPGPYACAEWDMGGLPWWLLKKTDLKVRTRDDAYFMERSKKYLTEVGKQLAPLQIQNGGNIIMVQVENEYGTFGKDSLYMNEIRDILRSSFDKVQLFRCDWSSNFFKYSVNGVATTLNFGAGSNIDQQFKKFKEIYPQAPLMCSEYWTGWFDYWGRPHETRSIESFIGSLKDMMDRKISFSLYMAHGGTSFGQWGGANSPPFGCMVASYDYNAPINEAGDPTPKFYAVRDLLKNYLNEGETLADVPSVTSKITIPSFTFTQTAALFDHLPQPKQTVNIQPMEMFDQGWGRILYRTKLPACVTASTLKITDLHDWALVFINGKQVGKLDRRKDENSLKIPPVEANAQLDILVEAMGRVNFGKTIIDRKGITQKVELISDAGTQDLKNWDVYNFPVDYGISQGLKFTRKAVNGPAWYKASFTLDKTGDTYLDMRNWGKGMVWVNGYNMGRYWNIGPQQTLYMPGCWLKKGQNEVIVLDLEGPKSATMAGLAEPILDVIIPDESMLHRKKGQKLDLSAETPVLQSSFPEGTGWKEVSFNQTIEGRYFCLEALNSQKASDRYTSVAELEMVGEDGTSLPRTKWKVLYADSEEITAANQSADKVFDLQESTLWHTNRVSDKPSHPHQIVVDMGENCKVKGFRYLPRSDKSSSGMIKDFRIFVKTSSFKY
jgi:beta-galactosidase